MRGEGEIVNGERREKLEKHKEKKKKKKHSRVYATFAMKFCSENFYTY